MDPIDKNAPVPDDNDKMLAVNVQLCFRAPSTLKGAIAMLFLRMAQRLGVEADLEASDVADTRFGDLPQDLRDAMVVDMLTASPEQDNNTIIRRINRHPPKDE